MTPIADIPTAVMHSCAELCLFCSLLKCMLRSTQSTSCRPFVLMTACSIIGHGKLGWSCSHGLQKSLQKLMLNLNPLLDVHASFHSHFHPLHPTSAQHPAASIRHSRLDRCLLILHSPSHGMDQVNTPSGAYRGSHGLPSVAVNISKRLFVKGCS